MQQLLLKLLPLLEAELKPLLVKFLEENAAALVEELFKAIARAQPPQH